MESHSKLIQALEEYPNLANRALVILLENEKNLKKIQKWIIDQSKFDIRFVRLAEIADISLEAMV